MWHNQKNENNYNYKHGYRKSKLYNTWVGIKNRCLNKNTDNYKSYGGRGITICNEWLNFIPFMEWSLSNGYQEGLEIDRINTDGDYKPSNCQWITHKDNVRKQSQVILTLEIANEIRYLYSTDKYTQKEIAEMYNVKPPTIYKIINYIIWKN